MLIDVTYIHGRSQSDLGCDLQFCGRTDLAGRRYPNWLNLMKILVVFWWLVVNSQGKYETCQLCSGLWEKVWCDLKFWVELIVGNLNSQNQMQRLKVSYVWSSVQWVITASSTHQITRLKRFSTSTCGRYTFIFLVQLYSLKLSEENLFPWHFLPERHEWGWPFSLDMDKVVFTLERK